MSETSEPVESSSVEERLAFLESQNEGLKRVGTLLGVLVFLMLATIIYQSRSNNEAVATGGVILNNNLGKARGAITAFPNGHLGMLFYDFSGKLPQPKYKNIPYLDGIAIYDRHGNPRILLGVDDKDNPVMVCASPDGKTLFTAVPPVAPDAAKQQGGEGQAVTASPTPAATPQVAPTP